jgi:hypothetical protein
LCLHEVDVDSMHCYLFTVSVVEEGRHIYVLFMLETEEVKEFSGLRNNRRK